MDITLSFGSGVISDCESAWTVVYATTADTDADHKVGTYSVKIVCGANLAGKALAYKTISSKSLLQDRFVTLWLKSSVNLAAGDLKLLLDHATPPDGVSSVEAIALPAFTANTWKYAIVELANPILDGAIVSVGLWMVNNVAACNIYVDQVYAGGSKTFTVKGPPVGFDNPEDVLFLKSVSQDDLAGNTIEGISGGFKRRITFDLSALVSDKYRQMFFWMWWNSALKYITYGSETVQVALQQNDSLVMGRVNGFDFAHGGSFTVVEKDARTTVPTSWLDY